MVNYLLGKFLEKVYCAAIKPGNTVKQYRRSKMRKAVPLAAFKPAKGVS
jgi:hypothetical protein